MSLEHVPMCDLTTPLHEIKYILENTNRWGLSFAATAVQWNCRRHHKHPWLTVNVLLRW